ncbi:MAG: hypothetical protein IJC52_00140, partial [Clostridia bacterium]|nr:hypothetical protein [Clostridia bacterium]
MSNKPDYKQIKSLIKQATDIDKRLKAALETQKEDIAAVRRAADAFYAARFQASLESMDVDMLSQGKQGIRVAPLKSAGITNIYQLSKMTLPRIEAIGGIGEQGASKIFALTRQIVENTRQKLSVRIEVNTPTAADDALIAALYTLIERDAKRPTLDALFAAHHKPLQGEFTRAAKAASGMKWFFASKRQRDEALQAAASLQERLAGDLGDTMVLDAFEAVSTADITECRAHFREHSASYYAALEQHCKHLNTAPVQNTGLSEDLLAEIEAQEL